MDIVGNCSFRGTKATVENAPPSRLDNFRLVEQILFTQTIHATMTTAKQFNRLHRRDSVYSAGAKSLVRVCAGFALLLVLLCGCNHAGGTVRHGDLEYNAVEVFGKDTRAFTVAVAAARGD